jgi:hypothetical protein
MNLTPIFDQYLRHTAVPVLELEFERGTGVPPVNQAQDAPATVHVVRYRWKTDELGFAMPVRVGAKDHWDIIHPTTEWQSLKSGLNKENFGAATELYYIEVKKL